jgi:hypothetical protein
LPLVFATLGLIFFALFLAAFPERFATDFFAAFPEDFLAVLPAVFLLALFAAGFGATRLLLRTGATAIGGTMKGSEM